MHDHIDQSVPIIEGKGCLGELVPSVDRSRSAFAASDLQVSDQAASRGLDVSPARVQRWRLAGLLPAPDQVGRRPSEAPPGRLPLIYSDDRLAGLDDTVEALQAHSRRGRPPADLALILFALRLPVDGSFVRHSINERLERLRRDMDSLTQSALQQFPPPDDPHLRLSAAYDRAEALAQLAAERPTAVRKIRQNLRNAGLPNARVDLISVIVRLFEVGWADNMTDGVDDLMYALGLHGLRESVSPDVPALLDEGPTAFLEAARAVLQVILRPLPVDLAEEEAADGRDLVIDVARAFASAPEPALLHHLGGPAVAQLWNINDLDNVACIISGAVHIRRLLGPLDADPILAAVQANGWPLRTRNAFVRG